MANSRFTPILVFGVAAVAGLLFADDASARTRNARGRLVRAPGTSDTDALGRIRVRSDRRGREALDVLLRRLDPLAVYRLREAGSGTPLGALRTNRGGNGRLRLRNAGPGAMRLVDAPSFSGMSIEILDESGEVVLEGDCPDPGETGHAEVREAEAVFEAEGIRAAVSLRSDPRRGHERITVRVRALASSPLHLFVDDGLGTMTDLGAFDCEQDGDHEGSDGDPGTEGTRRARAGKDGDDEAGDDDGDGDGHDGDGDDADGDDGDGHDGEGDDGDDGEGDDGDGDDDGDDEGGIQECSWSADTADGDPLPFGVDGVGALGGRKFEIRDADGNVLLTGEIPGLPEASGGDDEGDDDGDACDHQDGTDVKDAAGECDGEHEDGDGDHDGEDGDDHDGEGDHEDGDDGHDGDGDDGEGDHHEDGDA